MLAAILVAASARLGRVLALVVDALQTSPACIAVLAALSVEEATLVRHAVAINAAKAALARTIGAALLVKLPAL